MFDALSSRPRYTLRVKIKDPSLPLDVQSFLDMIPDVEVYREGVEECTLYTPVQVYVVPNGEFNSEELFATIQDQTKKWLDYRTEKIIVELYGWPSDLKVLSARIL
jgi:hypothetical protein